VEEKVPGVKALSFVDDVAWLAEGDGANEISHGAGMGGSQCGRLRRANNGGDPPEQEKETEDSGAPPLRGIQVEGRTIHFNKQARSLA